MVRCCDDVILHHVVVLVTAGGVPSPVQRGSHGTAAMVPLHPVQHGQTLPQTEVPGEGESSPALPTAALYVLIIIYPFFLPPPPLPPSPSPLQIHMHGANMESLYEHIPQSKLPADFGGPLPHLSPASLLQLLKTDSLEPPHPTIPTTDNQGLLNPASGNHTPPDVTAAGHWRPGLAEGVCPPSCTPPPSAQIISVDSIH